MLASI
jgi:hypothetical protein